MMDFDNRDGLEDRDRRRKKEAVEILSDMASQTNNNNLTRVLDACTELDSHYRFMTAT